MVAFVVAVSIAGFLVLCAWGIKLWLFPSDPCLLRCGGHMRPDGTGLVHGQPCNVLRCSRCGVGDFIPIQQGTLASRRTAS